jgi:hypothetical protein
MLPYSIIKAHDVSENFSSCPLHGSKDMLGTFAFECCLESLHRGIIQAITYATHADGDAAIRQDVLVTGTGILTTTIRLVQQACVRLPLH